MKVFYQAGRGWKQSPMLPHEWGDAVVLSYNNWDDYSYRTTLNAAVFVNGDKIFSFAIKIMIEDVDDTAIYLEEISNESWDGEFPIPNKEYISVPSDVDFYSALLGKLEAKKAKEVLLNLRDAGYLEKIENDPSIESLVKDDKFITSLLREAGAKKAYRDGWRIFEEHGDSSISDFTLNIRTREGSVQPVNFMFNSAVLPYDINVLIGANGVGKSHCIKSLVEYWLGIDSGSKTELERLDHVPFDGFPNLSKLILVSYSPFENFVLDIEDENLIEKNAYKYFGFKKRLEQDGVEKIRVNHNLPATDSVTSLIKALKDDEKLGFMPNWIGKFNVISTVLKEALGCEKLAVKLKDGLDENNPFLPEYLFKMGGEQYLELDRKTHEELSFDIIDYEDRIDYREGVVFVRQGKKIELSSGQRLFCYIVINIAGEIRRDSLVVIDEPELFLHPTFEIKFISMLKKVLSSFKSKAILATHSLTIAREIPTKCVHVFHEIEDGLLVTSPPFETFGGDMQRISSYVFGDSSLSKPFDEWLEEKLIEYGSAKRVIDELGEEINEEIIMKLTGLEEGNGK
ncbi:MULTISPECIES: AAA family ATPase [Halomonadaceae]|uniref:AAA family ATPase n=1 Tax=Halomonadaceae TaxID=28256 RepID=UPI001598FA6F|nr:MULTISPECIES: AAA family ATPase [Halomonas]QJQ95437.1 ATP-binding protein [Halomonas sp. PA5]